MKIRSLLLVTVVFPLFFAGCASAPRSYTKEQVERPIKVLVNLSSDHLNWREDWRLALESYGYDVMFQDEVLTSSQTIKGEKIDIEKKNVLDSKDIKYEFRLSYIGAWDVVWFVKSVSFSVRDLETGRVIGSYRDDNFWAHPSVSNVVKKIEHDFLVKLWKK